MMELLNNSPEWVQIAFLACCAVGAMVMYRFKKYVLIISSGAIAIYLAIKNSFADDE